MRLRARIDGNQNEIVAQLRELGCSVAITSQLGKGFPDLVVGFKGKNYLLEIKDPSKPLSQRKLTKDEIRFSYKWLGQYSVIETIDDFLALLRM